MADENTDAFLGVKPAPAWHRYAKWGAIAVGVVLLALAARSYFGGTKEAGYATARVSSGDLTVSVAATGKLAPTNQVTVGSQLSGLVTRVVVDADRFMARISPSD